MAEEEVEEEMELEGDVDVDDTDEIDEVLEVDELDSGELDAELEAVEGAAVAAAPGTRKGRGKKPAATEEEEVVDVDEEHHPDDVEAPLDVLLKERTTSGALDDDEEELEDEDDIEVDDRGDGSTRIVPRRANEFLCQSCFLVLPLNQLADKKKMLCRDCA